MFLYGDWGPAKKLNDTVDGSEMMHQLIWRNNHYLQGLGYIPGGRLGFFPSTA